MLALDPTGGWLILATASIMLMIIAARNACALIAD